MKKHGVMLFTFVILFLTLGCDLAYGQGEEGNEKVTVTLDFSKEGAFGLKNSVDVYGEITNITFKVQDLSVSLTGSTCHYTGTYKYLRLDYDANHPGQLQISVPKPIVIDSIMMTTKKGIFIKYKNDFLSATENKPIVKSINSNNLTLTESKRTGEKAKSSFITTITLTITRPKIDAMLDEKALDAESTIKGIAGENKTLALNRTFNPSQLYTMCLPFDLSKEMIKGIFGSETKVYSYDGYQNGELSFSTVKEVNAGMPFLMRPEYYVEQPTFAGVIVESTTAPKIVTGGEWDLCGTFGSHELEADGTQLFLWKDGTLMKPKASSRTMRGFRCYLQKAAGTANASAQLPSVTIDGETNAIKTAEYAAPTSATTAYSLSGMKLNAGCKTANGGIMIIDGKKFITTNR